jgi:hypothetical protein
MASTCDNALTDKAIVYGTHRKSYDAKCEDVFPAGAVSEEPIGNGNEEPCASQWLSGERLAPF